MTRGALAGTAGQTRIISINGAVPDGQCERGYGGRRERNCPICTILVQYPLENGHRQSIAVKVLSRSKVARLHIAEGTRLFAFAGRPTKAQFIKGIRTKGTEDDLDPARRGGC
jgi:hypothetical protein